MFTAQQVTLSCEQSGAVSFITEQGTTTDLTWPGQNTSLQMYQIAQRVCRGSSVCVRLCLWSCPSLHCNKRSNLVAWCVDGCEKKHLYIYSMCVCVCLLWAAYRVLVRVVLEWICAFVWLWSLVSAPTATLRRPSANLCTVAASLVQWQSCMNPHGYISGEKHKGRERKGKGKDGEENNG